MFTGKDGLEWVKDTGFIGSSRGEHLTSILITIATRTTLLRAGGNRVCLRPEGLHRRLKRHVNVPHNTRSSRKLLQSGGQNLHYFNLQIRSNANVNANVALLAYKYVIIIIIIIITAFV